MQGLVYNNQFIFQKDIRHNEKIRKSFNKLAMIVYGFQFEEWYQAGYWTDCYNPYVLLDNDKVVAAIAVNQMKFEEHGIMRNYIQLGTVMTDPDYRKLGLSRFLMNLIIQEWLPKTEGIYLFANDSVLDFYPKFGFIRQQEYHYTRPLSKISKSIPKKIDMSNSYNLEKFVAVLEKSALNGAFSMRENPGLVMFYITGFMKDMVYFLEENDTFVVAQVEKDKLLVHGIYSKNIVSVDLVVDALMGFFQLDKALAELHFTPVDYLDLKYSKRIHNEEGSTLFVMGEGLEKFSEAGFMFETLSHA